MLEPLYDWVVLEPQYEKAKKTVTKTRVKEDNRPTWKKFFFAISSYYDEWQEEYEEEVEYDKFLHYKVLAAGPGRRQEGAMIVPHVKVGDLIPDEIHDMRFMLDGTILARESDIPAIIREDK